MSLLSSLLGEDVAYGNAYWNMVSVMVKDCRGWHRFCPQGIIAHIVIANEAGQEVITEGLVVDMSYGGIKIKLTTPLPIWLESGKLYISLELPVSKVKVTIQGKIKHVLNQNEVGLQYAEQHTEHELDDLLFECIKFSEPSVLD